MAKYAAAYSFTRPMMPCRRDGGNARRPLHPSRASTRRTVPAASQSASVSGRPRPLSPLSAALSSPRALLPILALATCLRTYHLYSITHSPLASTPLLDHRAYDAWAQRIAAGDWLGRDLFWVDPLYAYFLAALYALFGHDLLLVRLVQSALGLLNIALASAIAHRLTASRALANVTALVTTLCIPLLHNEVQLEKATLATTLASGALLLFLRATPRASLGAGLLLGLAALTRGNLLLFVPAGALALALTRIPSASASASVSAPASASPPASASASTSASALRRAALFTLAASAVIGALSLRNYLVTGDLTMTTTTNAGANLYIAHQRTNTSGTYAAPSFVRPDPHYEQQDFHAEAERRAGHPLSAPEASRFWADEALHEIAADPLAALTHTLTKLRLAFHQFEIPDNDDVALAARYSPVLRLPLFGVGHLAPFALLGAVALWRRSREARLVAGAVALYAATLALVFVVGRFRVPMIPPLAALAVAGAAWLIDRIRARDTRRALTGAAAVLLGLALCLGRTDSMDELQQTSLAVSLNNLGAQLLLAGDSSGAIEAYEAAIATRPASVVGAMRSLGDLYLQQGRYADAERVMRRVLDYKPGSRLAQEALARLYRTMAQDPRHAGDDALRRRLADAHLAEARQHRAAGQWSAAISAMQEAVRVGPYDEGTRYALGELMEQHADPDDMIAFWSAQLPADPKPQTSLYYWAIALERQGDTDAALRKLAEALDLDPAHEASELRIALILLRRGDLVGALLHCERAADIFPDFRGAHEVRVRLLDALGRDAEAAEAREAARRSNPNTRRRFLYWGRYLLRAGRPAQAAAELERAVAADPGDAETARLLREARATAAP